MAKEVSRNNKQNLKDSANFEVFTAVKIEFVAFWVLAPCSVMVGYQHFGGTMASFRIPRTPT
jgi:hypothetical protein